MPVKKVSARNRRHIRIRAKIGKSSKPRLIVFRSLKYNYAQLFDDTANKVIAEASDIKLNAKGTKLEKAKKVGEEIAKKALEKNVSEITFDRNGYKYHGRVKAIADGAREGGLKF